MRFNSSTDTDNRHGLYKGQLWVCDFANWKFIPIFSSVLELLICCSHHSQFDSLSLVKKEKIGFADTGKTACKISGRRVLQRLSENFAMWQCGPQNSCPTFTLNKLETVPKLHTLLYLSGLPWARKAAQRHVAWAVLIGYNPLLGKISCKPDPAFLFTPGYSRKQIMGKLTVLQLCFCYGFRSLKLYLGLLS